MLFLKSWLEDYIDLINIDNKTLAELITTTSSEVEEIIVKNDIYDSLVKVGKITNLRIHPDNSRIKYFDVYLGSDQGADQSIQIVSTADNVREGLIIPVAMVGANIGGMVILKKKILGIESNGVCLGKSELNLETSFSSGLYELNNLVNETNLGQSICKILPQYFPEEIIFEIKVLPDKISKIGNHLGMATEIAIALKNLNLLRGTAKQITNIEGVEELKNQISKIRVDNNVRNIIIEDNVGYSSSFALFDLQLKAEYTLDCKKRTRMLLLNQNLTDTVADFSNYLQLDLGQPSHFFASESITSNQLKVTKIDQAKPFQGLGQLKDTELPIGTVVLEDYTNKILSIPAISGSLTSSVNPDTTSITIELASFDYDLVANNSFKLNYRSSASKLYSSDIDSFSVLLAFIRIVEEFKDLGFLTSLHHSIKGCNGNLLEWLEGLNKPLLDSVSIDYNYLNNRLGLKDYYQEIKQALPYYGFVDGLSIRPFVSISSIKTNEDILRDVVRSIGYMNLEKEYIKGNTEKFAKEDYYNLIKLKQLVVDNGFFEIATRPFLHNKHLHLSDQSKNHLKLLLPYRENVETLRSDLNISLLESLANNINDGYKDAKLFEVSRAYHQKANQLIEQSYLGAGLIGIEPMQTAYLATSVVNKILAKINLEVTSYNKYNSVLGSVCQYLQDHTVLAEIIEVSNKTKKLFGLPLNKKVFLLTVNLPSQIGNFDSYSSYQDESPFPTIRRSYNLIIPKAELASNIINNIKVIKVDFAVNIDTIERIAIDEITDKLLLDIKYSSHDKTLTNKEIEVIETVINNINSTHSFTSICC